MSWIRLKGVFLKTMGPSRRGPLAFVLVASVIIIALLRSGSESSPSTDHEQQQQTLRRDGGGSKRSSVESLGERRESGASMVWVQPGPVSFLAQNVKTVKTFLSSSSSGLPPSVTHVCVFGSAEKIASSILPLFMENADIVFFDSTPVEGNHSGVFVTSIGNDDSNVHVVRYVGHPHFTLRRFFSDYPARKCHIVLLDDSAEPARIDKPERLAAYLHSHTSHVASGERHIIIAATSWKEVLTGIRDWVIGCRDESNNGLLDTTIATSSNELIRKLHRVVPSGVFVACFRHDMPFPNKDLALILESASWEKIDLAPYDVAAVALQAEAKKIEYWLEGHSGEITLERKIYASIASLPVIRTICEIGFNAGHSASLWLLANPTARVFMFDLFEHKYSKLNEVFLRREGERLGVKNVNERLFTINGSSIETVPKFAADRPDVKCDLLSVDGGHFGDIPLKDMQNMRRLANHDFHVLVVDDTNCDGTGCVDGQIASLVREGSLKVLGRVAEGLDLKPQQQFRRGVTVLQYTPRYLAEP